MDIPPRTERGGRFCQRFGLPPNIPGSRHCPNLWAWEAGRPLVAPGFLGIKSLRQPLVAEWWVPRSAGQPVAEEPSPSAPPQPAFLPLFSPVLRSCSQLRHACDGANGQPERPAIQQPRGLPGDPIASDFLLDRPPIVVPATASPPAQHRLPGAPAEAGQRRYGLLPSPPWGVFRQCKRNWANPKEKRESKKQPKEP